MLTLLLPLNRYKVNYEIGTGRPYSELEQLVLRAFSEEEKRTINDLQNIFCLPNRLIVEVLVTLAQAGWIAISNDPEGSFILTSKGEAALDSSDDKLPPGTSISSKEAFIIMERFTGGIISPSEIIYKNKRELDDKKIWEFACRLPVRLADNNLGIEQVQHLLPKGQGERIRFIASPELISQDYYWLLVNADLEEKRMIGLPDCWQGSLKEFLLEKAEEFAQKYPDKAKESFGTYRLPERKKETAEGSPGTYSTRIHFEDLLITHCTHIEQLQKALTQAKSTILIASAFLNIDNLSNVKQWVLDALRRGVHVDLLWGYRATNQSEKRTKEWLVTLQKEAKKAQGGNLRINEVATDSHAKLLIYDSDKGYRAYVGSYNWLSKPTEVGTNANELGSDVTVCLHHQGLIADLSRSVASLWDTGQRNHLSSDAPNHWQRIAETLEGEIVQDTTDEMSKPMNMPVCKVRIVHANEHEGLMRQYLRKAQKRCVVVSHQIDPDKEVAGFRLIEPLQKRSDELETITPIVLYGDSERLGDGETTFRQQVEGINGALKYKEGLHSKVVVVDNTAIISSYNFLSGDPSNKAKRVREIGVLIEGGNVPDKLWEIFSN
jgi:phosphatidylserine/phosphatidylglycerophosphate/cardiolipin synthase-like enzyme